MSVSAKIQKVIDWLESTVKEEKEKEINVKILGMGNPLLDISCTVDDKFMEKYGIKPNNAILAEPKHLPMYEELSKMPNVDYIGGGSTLNSIRVCQWMLQEEGSTGYFGCIGKDKYGELLSERAKQDGVLCHFMIQDKVPTGTCAVCITHKERSLVANLSAANEFKKEHLENEKSKLMLSSSKLIYSAGFFITVSPESMLISAKHCMENNKPYCINFSAEFIVNFFKEKVLQIFPYATHVFGNESESIAFATANNIEYKNMKELALKISNMKCERKEGRKVIITQGKKAVVIAHNDHAREYPVKSLPAEKIVDLNGAGDAFVGGYLSQMVQGKDEKVCVAAAVYSAQFIIQTSGTKLVGKQKFVYSEFENDFKDI